MNVLVKELCFVTTYLTLANNFSKNTENCGFDLNIPLFFLFFCGGVFFSLKYKKLLDQGYGRQESINLAKCHLCQSYSEKRGPHYCMGVKHCALLTTISKKKTGHFAAVAWKYHVIELF